MSISRTAKWMRLFWLQMETEKNYKWMKILMSIMFFLSLHSFFPSIQNSVIQLLPLSLNILVVFAVCDACSVRLTFLQQWVAVNAMQEPQQVRGKSVVCLWQWGQMISLTRKWEIMIFPHCLMEQKFLWKRRFSLYMTVSKPFIKVICQGPANYSWLFHSKYRYAYVVCYG